MHLLKHHLATMLYLEGCWISRLFKTWKNIQHEEIFRTQKSYTWCIRVSWLSPETTNHTLPLASQNHRQILVRMMPKSASRSLSQTGQIICLPVPAEALHSVAWNEQIYSLNKVITEMYQESKQMQHANNNRNGYCHIQIDIKEEHMFSV